MRFKDRREVGLHLADELTIYTEKDVVVLGDVPVAYEVAQRLKAPLDVFLVRKLVVAVPVVAESACQEFRQEVDAMCAPLRPRHSTG